MVIIVDTIIFCLVQQEYNYVYKNRKKDFETLLLILLRLSGANKVPINSHI